MKIAILNECFLNDKHLSRLEKLGKVKVYENTTAQQLKSRVQDVDIVVVDGFLTPVNEILSQADDLKLLVLSHTSFAMVDLELAKNKKVKVVNAPGFSKRAVAELAIGLAFAVNRKITQGDLAMRENPFEADPGNITHQDYFGFDFENKVWGVIGLGKIGTEIAKMANGLGMNVLAFNRTQRQVEDVKLVELDKLLKLSDVVSISLALNPDTEKIISERELGFMKPNSILINVGAAKHVDTDALYNVLQQKSIGGAGLDIVDGIKKDHPILKMDNVVFTPHIGSFSTESYFLNLPEIITSNVEAFVTGSPQNLVN